jgi:hypothetical protein
MSGFLAETDSQLPGSHIFSELDLTSLASNG